MNRKRNVVTRFAALLCLGTLAGCQTPAPTGTAPGAAPNALNAAGPRRYLDLGAQVTGVGVDVCVLPGLLGSCPKPTPTPTPAPCVTKPYAVFTHSDRSLLHLAGLHMAGLSNQIVGDTHSNDQTWMAGTTEVITGRDEARAGWIIAGLNNKPGTQVKSTAMAFPAPVYANADFGAATFTFTGDTDLKQHPECWDGPNQLKPGIYRSSGRIELSTCNVKGNVTFVAAGLCLSGHKLELTAYTRGVLAYVDGHCITGKDVHFLGCESHFTGQFLAYNGEVLVAGDKNQIDGSIFSNTFDLLGLCNVITAPAVWMCQPTSTPTPTPTPAVTPTPGPSAGPTTTPSPAGSPSAGPSATPTPGPTPSGGGTPPSPTGSASPNGGPALPGEPSGTTWSIDDAGNPFALALDEAQNLWVSHCGSHQNVTKIDQAGNQLGNHTVGVNGHDIAVDANRHLTWVTVSGDQLVYGLNPDASEAFRVVPGGDPEGVAVDASGKAWVCGGGDGVVWTLDPTDGHTVSTFYLGDRPRGIAFDGAGHAWVTLYGAKQVVELAADGTELGRFATDTYPSRVAIDGAGNAWVTCTGVDVPYPEGTIPGNTVMKFAPSGQLLGSFQVGSSPFGVAFDHQGNALVVNTVSNDVTKLSPSGQRLATYAVGAHPYNVVVDRNGYAWISNFEGGTITKLAP
ncbi:MAG: repeat containing protein [Cyanobacteria bacterium RYN_339]|nr:repeat containing protein [Cyanobacteria bacterium RYN_339]